MTPQDQQQQQTPIQQVGGTESVREQDKIQLVLSYLWCLSLIPLLTVKDSDFVKFHAKQGTALFLAGVAVHIVAVILAFVGIGVCLSGLAMLAELVVSIVAIMKAMKGERWRIPVLADLADKF